MNWSAYAERARSVRGPDAARTVFYDLVREADVPFECRSEMRHFVLCGAYFDATLALMAELCPRWWFEVESHGSAQGTPCASVWGPVAYGKPGATGETTALALLSAVCAARAFAGPPEPAPAA